MVADERLTEFTVRAHHAAVEQRRGYQSTTPNFSPPRRRCMDAQGMTRCT
jgi:hypothetical protein